MAKTTQEALDELGRALSELGRELDRQVRADFTALWGLIPPRWRAGISGMLRVLDVPIVLTTLDLMTKAMLIAIQFLIGAFYGFIFGGFWQHFLGLPENWQMPVAAFLSGICGCMAVVIYWPAKVKN